MKSIRKYLESWKFLLISIAITEFLLPLLAAHAANKEKQQRQYRNCAGLLAQELKELQSQYKKLARIRAVDVFWVTQFEKMFKDKFEVFLNQELPNLLRLSFSMGNERVRLSQPSEEFREEFQFGYPFLKNKEENLYHVNFPLVVKTKIGFKATFFSESLKAFCLRNGLQVELFATHSKDGRRIEFSRKNNGKVLPLEGFDSEGERSFHIDITLP